MRMKAMMMTMPSKRSASTLLSLMMRRQKIAANVCAVRRPARSSRFPVNPSPVTHPRSTASMKLPTMTTRMIPRSRGPRPSPPPMVPRAALRLSRPTARPSMSLLTKLRIAASAPVDIMSAPSITQLVRNSSAISSRSIATIRRETTTMMRPMHSWTKVLRPAPQIWPEWLCSPLRRCPSFCFWDELQHILFFGKNFNGYHRDSSYCNIRLTYMYIHTM
mmetsp:Transcript_3326/g.9552  ORF Transcript_3326/g.9552 Transcript_3326/m.9552 type:complete len:219 (-) Transcript_3326:12-668(-)